MKNSKNMSVHQILKKYLSSKKNINANIYKASDSPNVTKVPIGILALDYITDGGIPVGRITQLFGDYSSGKTTLALMCANSFLKKYPESEVLFFDFEGAFDKKWAAVFVNDLSRINVVSPTCGEDGLEIMLSCITQNSDISLIIIDSLASIIPLSELDSTMFDQQVGAQARLVAKFFRKFIIENSRKENKYTLLVLNQVRARIGNVMFGPTTKPATGYATGHFCSVILKTANKKIDTIGETPVKQTFVATLEKSKVGGFIKRKAEYTLCLQDIHAFHKGEFIEHKQIFTLAKALKIDIKALFSVGTLKEVEALLEENKEARLKLKNIIYQQLWGCAYDCS